MVDEFSTEFTSDPPRHPAQPRSPCREDQREFRRRNEILGDNPNSAVGHISDHAVARQRSDAELNLRWPLKGATFALAPLHKHLPPIRFGNPIGNPFDFA